MNAKQQEQIVMDITHTFACHGNQWSNDFCDQDGFDCPVTIHIGWDGNLYLEVTDYEWNVDDAGWSDDELKDAGIDPDYPYVEQQGGWYRVVESDRIFVETERLEGNLTHFECAKVEKPSVLLGKLNTEANDD